MKAHLIDAINQKEVVNTRYNRRLEEELIVFEPHLELINHCWQLKKQGHLLYPESNAANSSLVLHLLDLNPMDPLLFDLPFWLDKTNVPADLRFYCNDSAFGKLPRLSLQPLRLLTDLEVVCQYLSIDLTSVSKKIVAETHVYDFIEELLRNIDLRSRSYFLQETVIQAKDMLEDCCATSFDELVKFIHKVYVQVHPNASEWEQLIAEIYMDVIRVGWIWWFGRLKSQ